MSRRYGRNQKRAHRTRIAELEAEVAALKKDNCEMYDCAKRLSDEIECAKRIVGQYCVAFQPRSMTMSLRQSDYAEVMEYEQKYNIGVYRYWDVSPEEILAPINMNRIRLPIMCVLSDLEKIRGSRHMRVVYDGKAWGYAIDPMAWRMARYPVDLCRYIAERLTHLIYEEMSKDPTVHAELRRTHTRDQYVPEISFPKFGFPGGFPDHLR